MDNKNTELNSSFSGVKVHPNAFVDPRAELHDGVIISQGAIVGPNVTIGKGTEIGPNAVISGRTQIGINNKVFPSVFIGLDPQDLKYKGEKSELTIGNNNTIREHVTINPGTSGGGLITSIGNNCLLMVGCHVAHDCKIENNVILVNNASLAGHVVVEDFAIIGALSGVHQFTVLALTLILIVALCSSSV